MKPIYIYKNKVSRNQGEFEIEANTQNIIFSLVYIMLISTLTSVLKIKNCYFSSADMGRDNKYIILYNISYIFLVSMYKGPRLRFYGIERFSRGK